MAAGALPNVQGATQGLAQQFAQRNASFGSRVAAAQTAKQSQEAQQAQPPSFLQKWVTGPVGRVSTSMLDSAVSSAEGMMHDATQNAEAHDRAGDLTSGIVRVARDAATGLSNAAVNTGNAVEELARTGVRDTVASVAHPARTALEAEDPAMLARDQDMEGSNQPSPIWSHAKNAILDFRDAMAVKDPNLVDNLTQGVAQLAIPFAGYARALGGLHDVALATNIARTAVAGAATDSTALDPHAMRMADLLALGRHTEGKFGDVLRTIAPDGSALNAYINYLTDRGDEGEAEGRFKNVLDGFGVNMIATPLLGLVGSSLKQGTAGIRSMIEGGVTTAGDLRPRPPLKQMYDPAEQLLDEQVKRDADAAQTGQARGMKRPPLVQGGSPATDAIFDTQARQDVDASGHWDNAQSSQVEPSASPVEDDTAAAITRHSVQMHSDVGNEQPLQHIVQGLHDHMDDSSEDGQFYRELFGRIAKKNLGVNIVPPGSGAQAKEGALGPNISGNYNAVEHTIALHKPAFRSNRAFIHTVGHEAVHAGTMNAIKADPETHKAFVQLLTDAKTAAKGTPAEKAYGLTNSFEMAAEAESNPKFQRWLKSTKDASGNTLWDGYKSLIGGIFGIPAAMIAAPQFEKILEKSHEQH